MMRKPKVVILGTGGTIAGKAGSNTEMTGYQAGEIGIQTLINAVPEMLEVADVTGEQFCNIGSFDMIDDIWLRLSRRVSELLQQPEVDGIVITHGTDTLEETAYFLNLTVKSEKPVVLVGAMRPATAMSADGPVNLLNAVALAGSQEAVGKGVLIAMNDQINGARDATKTNTTHVETFKSWELGYLGYFQNGKPIFYKASLRRHTAAAEFDISKVTALPRVDIVYLHVNCDDILVRAAVSAGALGIVIAAFGHGNLHINIKPALINIARSGIPVVVLNLKTYEDVKHSIKILGELTGQKEKGLKIASELDKKVQNTVKQLPKNTKRVAILHSSAQNVTLEKENSIAGCVAKLLQLHNIVQDIQSVTAPTGEQMSDKAPYNLEFLIEKDPEIIFITSMGDKNDIEVRLQNDVMSSPAWESITAVKNNAVYYLPDELFLLNPGLRYSQAVEYMASKLQE